ncbi:hypothetical protein [Actinoplanes xinjiangensis]|uniref:hypothetical protein n=1 Tax=Actinoplanes xinjiangensis TaxID=512350 RepID=UPI0011B6699E|nr:hypothetical protein [Actinoplanes xinjiangensis]GIF37252.1 hypothetical protein Axi01nite_15630 [Actinoplanes xinjiangensis]
MSLFGYFIVARSARPIGDLPCVQRACRHSLEGGEPAALGRDKADGDWQYVYIYRGQGLYADDVANETGAPALVIDVIESAVGIVHGATPDRDSWWGCLNPAEAVRVYDMPPDMVASSAETVQMATEWAAATGRAAHADLAVTAVERYVGGFGESVNDFVAALGFQFERHEVGDG